MWWSPGRSTASSARSARASRCSRRRCDSCTRASSWSRSASSSASSACSATTATVAVFGTDQLNAQAMLGITAFNDIWYVGQFLFGLHLLLIGYLAYRSGYLPRVLGVLLAICRCWATPPTASAPCSAPAPGPPSAPSPSSVNQLRHRTRPAGSRQADVGPAEPVADLHAAGRRLRLHLRSVAGALSGVSATRR